MEPKANRKPGTRTYLSIWNLGLVRQLSFLPLMLAVFGVPVRAARVCDSFGNCRVYISKRPVPLRAQETPVWCWAASLSMLFAYYNYPVQQEAIVTRYFGAPLPVPGPPWILRDALNTDWTDATGKRFRVTSRITDLYGGSSFQVSNADIVGALADEKPVFYADANHALILVQTDYIAALPQPIIVAGWAIDPYPGPNFGFRQLQPSEMQASFAAIADVRDVTAVPSISRITNGASYTLEIAPQGFVTIFGTNLASAVTSWDRYIVNDQLPSSILGTSVTINGRAAFVSYVSPTQINAIVPATTSSGTISVSVATPNGTATGNVLLKQRSPGLFASSWLGRTYAVAAPVSSPRSFVAPTGAVPGTTRSARRGEVLQLFATGLGSAIPAAPDGRVIKPPYPQIDVSRVIVSFGGIAVRPTFVGMTFAGLFQINVQVPQAARGGDIPITIQVDSDVSTNGVYTTIEP